MVGVQFADVGDTDKNFSTGLILDNSFVGYDEDLEFSTIMRVWNGIGYDYFGWSGTSGTDIDEDSSYDNQWLDSWANIVDGETMPPSFGAWIIADKAGTMLTSGEVRFADLTVDLQAGFNLVANPYPCDVKIAEFGLLDASYAGYDEDLEFSTIMRKWNGIGYDYFGWSGTSGTDIDEDSSYDNQWLDSWANITDEIIPAGASVWIIAEKAGTISFTPKK